MFLIFVRVVGDAVAVILGVSLVPATGMTLFNGIIGADGSHRILVTFHVLIFVTTVLLPSEGPSWCGNAGRDIIVFNLAFPIIVLAAAMEHIELKRR